MNTKKIIYSIACLLLLSDLSYAEKCFELEIGPLWPRVLLDSKKPTSWNTAFKIGYSFDNIISLGGGVDFLWNRYNQEKNLGGNVYKTVTTEQTYMFPFSGFISITPLPDLKIQPCFSGQIGLNTMYFSHSEDSVQNGNNYSIIDENGWYMGVYWKIAADALFKLSKSSGIFTGVDYQWTRPRKLDRQQKDIFTRRDMSGIGFRIGIRAEI
jgi:hypothetical protein